MLLYLKGDLSFSDTTCGIILLSYFLSQYEVHSLQWIVKYNSDSSDNVNILPAIKRDRAVIISFNQYTYSSREILQDFLTKFEFVQRGYINISKIITVSCSIFERMLHRLW